MRCLIDVFYVRCLSRFAVRVVSQELARSSKKESLPAAMTAYHVQMEKSAMSQVQLIRQHTPLVAISLL